MGGFVLPLYADAVCAHWRQRHWLWLAFHTLFVGYILAMAISQQLIDWWRYGFGYAG
jgi:hypothetical protein